MGLRSTYRPKLGPIAFNTSTKHGLTSVTIRLFGATYRLWGRDKKRGVTSVDLPGPLSYRPGSKRKNT